MTALRLVAALLLWLLAGRGVLRLTCARRLSLGPLATPCAWLVSGVVAGAFVTTMLGVLGLPVRPWPVSAPLLGLLAIAGGLPRRLTLRKRSWRDIGYAEIPTTLTALLMIPIVVIASRQRSVVLDEYAIWSFKAKIFRTAGHVVPAILGDNHVYEYAHSDYPLLLPSAQVWTEGWIGHASDKASHLVGALIAAAGLVVVAALVKRIVTVWVSIAVMVAIGATSAFAVLGTILLGDELTCVYTTALALTLVIAITADDVPVARAAAGLAVPLAAGAAMTKNEGLAFVVALVVAAVVVLPRAHWRLLLLPFGAAVIAYLPWSLWARVHHVPNDFLGSGSLSALGGNLDRLQPVLSHMATYWPGPALLSLVVVAVAVGFALLVAPERRRALLLLLIGAILQLAALLLTYLVSPENGPAFWRNSMPRVLITPGVLVWVLAVLAASWCLPTKDGPGVANEKAMT